MRSLIWQRLQWAEEIKGLTNRPVNGHFDDDATVGKSLLFFGCRNENADYFYNEEWESIGQSLPLQVFPAFSRDQSQKMYVQDLIREHSTEAFKLLHDFEGTVYVCGSSGKMPIAVRAALVVAFQEGGSMDHQSAEEYLEQMEKEGRYKQETW